MSNIDKLALLESAESTINILENIAGFEPSDIDGDTVELRFENEDGFDTGCDVSIVDQCHKAADVVRALLDELEAKDRRLEEEIGRANREHHRGFMMACGHMKEHSNVHYADAAEMEIAALRKRINELESAAAGKGE